MELICFVVKSDYEKLIKNRSPYAISQGVTGYLPLKGKEATLRLFDRKDGRRGEMIEIEITVVR
ncbi:hypothetical protein KAI56_02425 [Candidatus Parcubacteria bacterium]|nr:hypothetical protein [Candidatus Parcubacteria bacterium]